MIQRIESRFGHANILTPIILYIYQLIVLGHLQLID